MKVIEIKDLWKSFHVRGKAAFHLEHRRNAAQPYVGYHWPFSAALLPISLWPAPSIAE